MLLLALAIGTFLDIPIKAIKRDKELSPKDRARLINEAVNRRRVTQRVTRPRRKLTFSERARKAAAARLRKAAQNLSERSKRRRRG